MAAGVEQLRYCFFGLSGSGKSTFMQKLSLPMPKFTVTRSPRPDDDPSGFRYVSYEDFSRFQEAGDFIFEDGDGSSFYGYLNRDLGSDSVILLYGLPSKIEQIKQLGIKRILIQADAKRGLEIRNDPGDLKERREIANARMSGQFYQNPRFLKQIDLTLTNHYSSMQGMMSIFHAFMELNRHELRARSGSVQSLNFVLQMHSYPLEGMRSRLSHWMKWAVREKELISLFYSKCLASQIPDKPAP